MDEYILMNDDTGFIAESDIENLCKLVDLHALMIQELYDEDLETVESYIESVISNYFNDVKAVQEADSEEVFIDPRVIKAAKVYKHNKENPSSTVFIDPKAINAMAYVRNSKEYTKKQLKPILEEIIKDPNIKHIKLSDIDPYAKLYDAEGLVNTANREKKELKEIKNHKTKDDPKFADLNKFMYDKMSNDRDERVKKLSSVKPGKFNPGKKYRMEGVKMDDEYIMMSDHEDAFEESYDDVTLEDVESYLESMRNDITDAMELRDNMIQEEYEYEDLSLEDVESYIESTIDNYNSGVDLYNTMIQESDDNVTDNFEEGVINKIKAKSIKESYTLDNPFERATDLELDEPLTAYEFFDESYEPDDTPIVPRSNESIEYTQEVTVLELLGLTAAAIALIKTGKVLINRFTTNKKYGRFPKDMKRVYDIIESENFEASENKRALKKAFRALSNDLTYMLHGFGSRWKITVNEAEEIRKLKRHVDDLYTHGHMLTSSKQLSDKRRVGERIEGFLKQGNKVLEILNKSIYKNASDDAVTEWMV